MEIKHTYKWRSLEKIILQKIDYFEEKEKDKKILFIDVALLNKSKLSHTGYRLQGVRLQLTLFSLRGNFCH